LGKRIGPADGFMAKKEQFIEITTVIGCKNMCSYCPQAVTISSYKKVSNGRMMTFDMFRRYIETTPSNVRIVFSGFAEPFQNKDVMRMIRYAYDKGHKININTTLMGMTEEDIDGLLAMDISAVIVHLQNEKEKFVEMDAYLKLLAKCTKLKNVTFVYFGKVDNRALNILKEYGHTPVSLEIKSRAGALFNKKHKRGKLFCAARKELEDNVLLPNGDVVLCCMDFGLRHKLGNLLTDRYEDLHSGSNWKELKRKFGEHDNDLICRDCEVATVYLSLKFFLHPFEKFYKKWKKVSNGKMERLLFKLIQSVTS
jgi:radical SAM protein with 4Fe4S-binding SPASM domain